MEKIEKLHQDGHKPMKWLFLLGLAFLLYLSKRRRRGDSRADARFDFLISAVILAVVGVAMLSVAFKVGLVGMAVGLAGLGLLSGLLALGLMKLRR